MQTVNDWLARVGSLRPGVTRPTFEPLFEVFAHVEGAGGVGGRSNPLDVMVEYIARKNGGSAVYSEKDISPLGHKVKILTVTINGRTKTYTIGEQNSVVRLVNGKYVISHNILMTDFRLTEEQATHQPGDGFDTMDHAAMAWGFMHNGKAIAENTEYASEIYIQNGKYKYTAAISGEENTVGEGVIPMGTTLVGGIHAHAAYSYGMYDDENFSGANGDKGFADWRGVPEYIVTPGGYLKKYNPSNKKVTTVTKGMPRDPNSPVR